MRAVGTRVGCWVAAGVTAASLLVVSGGEVATATPRSAQTEVGAQERSGGWSLAKSVHDQRGRSIRFRWWVNDCGTTAEGEIAPATRVRMWPVGTNTRVRYLRARFMWQQYNPTFGRWNTTLSKTYRSPDYATTWLSPSTASASSRARGGS